MKKKNIEIKLIIKISTIVILLILLGITIIGIINNKIINNNYSKEKYKSEQIEEEVLGFFTYKIYNNKDKNNLRVIVKINSENGIEYIKKSDGNIINVANQNNVALDYICSEGVEEQIIIKELGKEEVTEKILIQQAGNNESPLIINNKEELLKIQDYKDKLFTKDVPGNEIYYKLVSDIDLVETDWTPIGTEEKPFEGMFDGEGHIISNLTYSNNEFTNVGIFGYVTGNIKNIKINNFDILGKENVGALVGYSAGTITDIEASNIKIEGISSVGGIVGIAKNEFCNNKATGTVKGNENIGGCIGKLISRDINLKCYNNISKGTVEGESKIGGLIGYADAVADNVTQQTVDVSSCYTDSHINASKDNVGGLIGYAYAYAYGRDRQGSIVISKSYSLGDINSLGNNVGGLVGYMSITGDGSNWNGVGVGSISDCFTLVNINGNSNCGGLVGMMGLYTSSSRGLAYLTITNNYVASPIKGKDININPLFGVCHISIRKGGCTISDYNYFVPERTGLSTSDYGTSKSISNMFTQNEFQGWDFEQIWKIEEGVTMPYLRNMDKPDGVNK